MSTALTSIGYVICTPPRLVVNTILWVIEKIKQVFRQCIGYFVRISVFMFGVYHESGTKAQIMEWFKQSPCDTRQRHGFDRDRLNRSIAILEALGGMRTTLYPEDKDATVDCMVMRYQDLKASIEKKGGRWIEHQLGEETLEIITEDPTKTSSEWKKFSEETLSKMGWEETTIGDKRAFITARWNKDEKRPKEGLCFLRSHSPTQSYAMERKYIGKHIGLHADVCLYDYRGTVESQGEASEGGYYLDIKAVYTFLKKMGYKASDIWATGFCLGGAVAAALKQMYHREGLNLAIENSFDSMEKVMGNQVWPASFLGPFALPEIQSQNSAITSRVSQDSFDTVGKLQSLSSKAGKVVVIATDSDKTLAPDAHNNLFNAAQKCSDASLLVFRSPDPTKNGHSLDPLFDAKIWKQFTAILAC